MTEWFAQNEALFWWLGVASVAMFVATLIAIPLLISWLPEDYFVQTRRRPPVWFVRRPGWTMLYNVVKNFFGVIFIAAGLVMLFTPGQGLLSILIGISLADFPGKYELERIIISRPGVSKAVNWIRKKAGRPPLEIPSTIDPR